MNVFYRLISFYIIMFHVLLRNFSQLTSEEYEKVQLNSDQSSTKISFKKCLALEATFLIGSLLAASRSRRLLLLLSSFFSKICQLPPYSQKVEILMRNLC